MSVETDSKDKGSGYVGTDFMKDVRMGISSFMHGTDSSHFETC